MIPKIKEYACACERCKAMCMRSPSALGFKVEVDQASLEMLRAYLGDVPEVVS